MKSLSLSYRCLVELLVYEFIVFSNLEIFLVITFSCIFPSLISHPSNSPSILILGSMKFSHSSKTMPMLPAPTALFLSFYRMLHFQIDLTAVSSPAAVVLVGMGMPENFYVETLT